MLWSKFIIPLLLLTLVLSCKDEEVEPYFNKGLIEGYVRINPYDLELHSNTFVNVKAVGPYGETSIKAYKDPNSDVFRFKFTNLGNGTYKITASKDSFGIVDYYNIEVFGNDTIILPGITLYSQVGNLIIPQNPVFQSQNGNFLVFGNFSLNQLSYKYRFIAFLSSREEVSFQKYQTYGFLEQLADEKFQIYIPSLSPFKTGTKLYLVIYPINLWDPGYFNGFYSLDIFSSINSSVHTKTISFTIE